MPSHMPRLPLLLSIALTGALCAAPWVTQAQPADAVEVCARASIELTVPWPAGGGTDALARQIAEPLGRKLGKQIVIVNRGGAGGVVGTTLFTRTAAPDGCSLILATSSTNAAAPYLYKNVQFAPLDDFTPIGLIASTPNLLLVPPGSPFKTIQDLVAAAKSNPGKLSYGSGGVGASSHLAGALFARRAGIDVVHVPYQGSAPALTDLMGGQVDYVFDTGNRLDLVRDGRVRALAIAAPQRLEIAPALMTMEEAGVKEMTSSFWGGIAGPKGMDKAKAKAVNTALNDVLQDPALRRTLMASGQVLPARGPTPEEFQHFWREELKRYKEIVEVSGARLD